MNLMNECMNEDSMNTYCKVHYAFEVCFVVCLFCFVFFYYFAIVQRIEHFCGNAL